MSSWRLPRSPLVWGLVLACMLGEVTRVGAHDFWIARAAGSPSSEARVGERLDLALEIGDGFRGDPFPRSDRHITSFDAHDVLGVRRIPGIEGRTPAGMLKPRVAGALLCTYVSEPQYAVLSGARFRAYLLEEERADLLRARRADPRRGPLVRERFRRHAKAWLRVAAREEDAPRATPAAAALFRPVGHTLEWIVDRDPTTATQGERLGAQLLFRGKPLAGARVRAYAQAAGERPVFRSVTDAEGRVQVPITIKGVWLLRSLQIERVAPPDSAPDSEVAQDVAVKSEARRAEYESHWASLTFRIAGAPSPAPSAARGAPAAERR